jgi:hypothetical protein
MPATTTSITRIESESRAMKLTYKSLLLGAAIIGAAAVTGASAALASGTNGVAGAAPGIIGLNSPVSTPLASLMSTLPSSAALEASGVSQGVTVSVNSEAVSLVNIGDVARNIEAYYAARALSEDIARSGGQLPNVNELNSIRSEVPSPQTLVEQAVAYRIFDSAVYQVALRQGNLVPLATAKVDAQDNWLRYTNATSKSGAKLTQSDFEGPSAVLGLQRALTILQEENSIGGGHTPGVSRTAIFANWLSDAIASHLVNIAVSSPSGIGGLSSSSVAAFLPPGM